MQGENAKYVEMGKEEKSNVMMGIEKMVMGVIVCAKQNKVNKFLFF